MTMDDQHGAPPAEAAAAEARLKGHLGYLTPQEETALEEFRKLATKAGFYIPATEHKKASHDDGTLMYVDPMFILHSANPSVAGSYELGDSSPERRLSSSKTQSHGAKTTILMLFTRK